MHNILSLEPAQKQYPKRLLEYYGKCHAPTITVLGNPEILQVNLTGIFCSRGYVSSLLLPAYDVIAELRDSGKATIGGFHSAMEDECFSILLRGKQPIVFCPARTLKGLILPIEWQTALSDGRLAIVSPFSDSEKKMTKDRAVFRNRFVAAFSHDILVVYASRGGMVQNLCAECFALGIPVRVLNHPSNKHLIDTGFEPINLREYSAREKSKLYKVTKPKTTATKKKSVIEK